MIKKKDICKLNIDQKRIYICPYCGEILNINDYSLRCSNNHTFDIGKKGEIFLIKTTNYKESEIYNKELFIHRRNFINNNFYYEVYKIISNIINKYEKECINILDLGCGEGTHTSRIIELINKKYDLIGIDYSKSAINLATDYLKNNSVFIAADINNLPILDNSIDVVIDFLSPYNTNELNRVLKNNGIIIKVCPSTNYLKELKNKSYLNEDIVRNNIEKGFNIVESYKYSNVFNISKDNLNDLIYMTPIENDKLSDNVDKITIDMIIYVLNNK